MKKPPIAMRWWLLDCVGKKSYTPAPPDEVLIRMLGIAIAAWRQDDGTATTMGVNGNIEVNNRYQSALDFVNIG